MDKKIIVKDWDDIRNCDDIYSFITTIDSVEYISCSFSRYEKITLIKNEENIIKMIKCLNILGGNFEYTEEIKKLFVSYKWTKGKNNGSSHRIYDVDCGINNLEDFTELMKYIEKEEKIDSVVMLNWKILGGE